MFSEIRQPFIVTYCHELTEVIGDVVRLYHADYIGIGHTLRKTCGAGTFLVTRFLDQRRLRIILNNSSFNIT